MPISDTSQQLEVLLAVEPRARRRRSARRSRPSYARRSATARSAPGVQLPSTRDLAAPARPLAPHRRRRVRAARGRGLPGLRQGARPTRRRRHRRRRRRPTRSPCPATRRASTSAAARPTCRRSRAPAGCARCATRSRRSPTPSSATATRAASSALRTALADYLGRVRGVVADPAQVIVTCGSTQGQGLVFRALAQRGATRIAFEDPCLGDHRTVARRAGLEPVPIEVDDAGLRIDRLRECTRRRRRPDAGPPAPDRRRALAASGARRSSSGCARRGAVAIEDDYDAEFRYDRAAVGALQGLEPRAHRLRRLGQQDARARAPDRLADRAGGARRGARRGEAARRPRRRPASSSTRSPTSSSAASSTATCGGCAPLPRPARRAGRGARARASRRRRPRHRGRAARDGAAAGRGRRGRDPRRGRGPEHPRPDARHVPRAAAGGAGDAPPRLRADDGADTRSRRGRPGRGDRGGSSGVGRPALREARQPVVRDLVPGRGVGDELAVRSAGSRGPQSKTPKRIAYDSPSGLRLHMLEPHAEQKNFEKPSGGSHARRSSSPWRIRTDPGFARACGDADEPVRRWQRVQWHQLADTSGSVDLEANTAAVAAPGERSCRDSARGGTPRIEASSSSTGCAAGIGRPARRSAADTWIRQPGFALTYRPGSVASTCAALRSPSSRAASGCTRL